MTIHKSIEGAPNQSFLHYLKCIWYQQHFLDKYERKHLLWPLFSFWSCLGAQNHTCTKAKMLKNLVATGNKRYSIWKTHFYTPRPVKTAASLRQTKLLGSNTWIKLIRLCKLVVLQLSYKTVYFDNNKANNYYWKRC